MLTYPHNKTSVSASAAPALRQSRRTRYSAGAPGRIRRELGADLIKALDDLCLPPRFTGALFWIGDVVAILTTAVISYAIANPFATASAVVYIGIRQRYLSNLIHECAHLKLVRSKIFNTALGHVTAVILIQSFADYQDEHRDHHALLGKQGDPKLVSYVSKGATLPRNDKWEFVLHVIIANAVWTLPKQTVRSWFTKHPEERWRIVVARTVFWAAILALAVWTDEVPLLVCYWAVPLALVRPAANWISDLGNHAGLLENTDPAHQIRGWTSHLWARHLLGGHLDDMYHPTHHWCPKIPFRMLPQATRLIRVQYPRAGEIPWCSGFFFRRRCTPTLPCVIDDIVARLRPSQQSDW